MLEDKYLRLNDLDALNGYIALSAIIDLYLDARRSGTTKT